MTARSQMRRYLVVSAVLAAFIAVGLSSCGGDGGGTAGPGKPGTLSVTIKWPAARTTGVSPSEIPADTACVELRASNGGAWTARSAVARPTGETSSTLTLSDVPPGPVHFHFGAYSDYIFDTSNAVVAAGRMLAWAVADVTLAAGETKQVGVTLGTLPTRIAITAPANQFSVLKGNILPLTATAYDSEDNVLMVSNLIWTSSMGAVGSVDDSGNLTASTPGTTEIKATVGSIAGSATVTVANATTALDTDVTLQAGQTQDFIIAPSTTASGYVVDVTPTGAASAGALVGRAVVVPVWDGAKWNDVVRITNPAGSSVNANIKAYDISRLPMGPSWDLPFGDWAGFGLVDAATRHGYVPMVTPTVPSAGQTIPDVLVRPEWNGITWLQVLRVRVTVANITGNVRGFDVTSLPLVLDTDTVLPTNTLREFTLGPSTQNRAYVPAISPSGAPPAVGFDTLEVVPQYDGTRWMDVLRVTTSAATPPLTANVRAFAVDTAPAAVGPFASRVSRK